MFILLNRVKKPNIVPGTSTSEEVCPWETPATPPPRTPTRGRRKSGRVESESSSSDISVGISDVGEKVLLILLQMYFKVKIIFVNRYNAVY